MSNNKPDISNLDMCIKDVIKAALDNDLGPEDPTNYSQLRGRLEACRNKLPPLYRETFFKPFIQELNGLGESGFTEILLTDPRRERAARLMLDISHTILQNGERYEEIAIDSFQEVVSDLYDGFLSAEDRKGVNPPDKGAIPPLVKFGEPSGGPYTWPVNATSNFGLGAGVVNLPPSHSRLGLLGWGALGHETAGHDILHADTGLHRELSENVQIALEDQKVKHDLPEYWSLRIDETASDVCGILNMGPAAALAVIGYFRGLNAAFGGEPKLRNTGGAGEHPADILRGYLGASTVSLLSFREANQWAQILESETNKDLSTIRLLGNQIPPDIAKKSASIVASTICNTKLKTLENHSLSEIQNWRDYDQEIVKNELIPILKSLRQLPDHLSEGIYAAHLVAAAIEAAVSNNSDIPSIFNRMLTALKIMHDKNPSWGPLFVRQPGNLARRLVYPFFEPEVKHIELKDDIHSLRMKSKIAKSI